MERVCVVSGDGLLVAFVLRELVAFDDHVWKVCGELGDDNVSVLVVDVVVGVPVEHLRAALGVRDPVVEDLVSGQIVVVDPDIVDVDGTLVGSDGDPNRGLL